MPLVMSASWSRSWVRSRHPLLCAALAAVLLVACEEQSSGITGVTVVDTGCLVIPEEEDCPDRPLPARIVVADTEGEVVGRIASDQTGEFELALPPGDYRVQASNMEGAPLPSAEEMPVTVRQDEFTQVTISFDSGIR